MPDLVGHTLGQYRVVEQIGLGGMATVYKAYQPALDRYVAIKILPAYYAHEPGFAERFIREAKAVARLTHPHVLPIYDFGQENGLSYIVMQYVDAGTLKDLLGRPLSPATAADIIEQVADALDYAHEQGIIHRDVKPSNVLMDRRRWVWLSDFGLAKIVEGSVQLTGSGVGVGTPAYMAPEQGQGLQVDRRADIYSLGIILYEMATGRVPFEAETPMAVVVKHITEPLPLPHAVNPDVPEPVERVIMKALAENPADRYETAGKLAAALRKAVAGLDTALAGPPTVVEEREATQVVPPPAAKPVAKRKKLPTWAMVAAGVVGLILLAGCCAVAGRIRQQNAQQAAGATQTASAQVAATQAGEGSAPPAVPAATQPPPAGTPRWADAALPPVERALAFVKENPPLYEDEFSRPDSGWKVADDQQGRLGYQDGAYLMQVLEAVGKRNRVGVALPFDRPLADLALQVELTMIKGGPGANWAVTFRAQGPDKGLYAGLSAQPRGVGIGYISPEEERSLERGLVPDYRPSQPTQLMLVALGPDVEVYLDGQQVGVAHVEPAGPGRLFFYVVNTGDPVVAYRLDNVRVWDLAPLSGGEGKPAADLPVFDDFEKGRTGQWDLQPGWSIIQEEGGNHVLLGEKHSNATLAGGRWGDVVLHFKVKPVQADLLINLRAAPADSVQTRYMVHLTPDVAVLHRFHGQERGPMVADSPIAYQVDQWHQVKVIAKGGHIELVLDGKKILAYDDPDPLPPGLVSFENGDPPARNLIDEVVVEPIRP